MSNNIKISPKHGLNPTIPVCFWCGKEKQEIALMGRLKDDIKAPNHAIIDYDFCDECRKKTDVGVTFIGVSFEPKDPGMPPIYKDNGKDLYPTGDILCVKDEAVEHLLPGDGLAAMRKQTLKVRKSFVEEKIIKHWLKEANANAGETPDDAQTAPNKTNP